jgi:hypothetical protein
MVNILKNRLYVYDGILDNLKDALGMVDLSIDSLTVLNNVLLELNNNVANISNPHTTEATITNLRTNCANLINEYSGVVFHSRYNENKVLITQATEEEPDKDNVDFNYALPGVNDEVGASRDNFTFKPPQVGSNRIPTLPIKVTDSEGAEVKDADGSEVNFKLGNLSGDMENTEKVTNVEIRHRAEQYVVLITESIRDINRELQDQNANKRRLEFRQASVNNLKDACLGNFKNRKESVNTNYD